MATSFPVRFSAFLAALALVAALPPRPAAAAWHDIPAPHGTMHVNDSLKQITGNCSGGDRVVYVFPSDWHYVESSDPSAGKTGGYWVCFSYFLQAAGQSFMGVSVLPYPYPCGTGDVSVWVNQYAAAFPLSATREVGHGPGGYSCLKATRGLTVYPWRTPQLAECGSDAVVSHDDYDQGVYHNVDAATPKGHQLGYSCKSLYDALGFKLVLLPTATGPSDLDLFLKKYNLSVSPVSCPAGDLDVYRDYGGDLVPLSATNIISAYNGGYGCLKSLASAAVRPYRWISASDAQCGSDRVVAYGIADQGFGTQPGYYHPAANAARGDSFTCEPLLATLGWKNSLSPQQTMAALQLSKTVPSCAAPDMPAAVFRATSLMQPVAQAANPDGYACAKAAYGAGFSIPLLDKPDASKCGGGPVAAVVRAWPQVPQYYESSDAVFARVVGNYQCEAFLAAAGWTLAHSGAFALNGAPLAATAPACTAPDTAMWVSMSSKTMWPLTAADVVGKGDGGYICARAASTGFYGTPIPLQDWTSAGSAECGSDGVVAYKPGTTAYVTSADPAFGQSGYRYLCRPVVLALGWGSASTVNTLAGGIAIPRNPQCDNVFIDAAYLADGLTLNGKGSTGDCAGSRYVRSQAATWLNSSQAPPDFDRLKADVAASKLCADPWIGEAYQLDGPKRPPTAGECNASNYGPYNGDYNRLVALVNAFVAGTLGSGPSGKYLTYTAPSAAPCAGQVVWALTALPDYLLVADPKYGVVQGAYACRDDVKAAGLKASANFSPTEVSCPSSDTPVLVVNALPNPGYYLKGTPGFGRTPSSGGFMCLSEAQELGYANLGSS